MQHLRDRYKSKRYTGTEFTKTVHACKKLEVKQAKSAQKSYFIQKTLKPAHYRTNSLTIGNKSATTNNPHNLAGCSLNNIPEKSETL